jgi:hypothetical protein
MPVYGPFEHQDIVGLTTCKAIMDYVAPDLNSVPRAPALIERLLNEGGTFLDWSKRDREESKARRNAFVLEMAKRARAADLQPPERRPVRLPANTALLLIEPVVPGTEQTIQQLNAAWRRLGMPIWRTAPGSSGSALRSDIERELRSARSESLVIAGGVTNTAVEATARHASALGLQTYVVEDASLANLDGDYCTVASAADVLTAIERARQSQHPPRSATP